jgi:pimeloyl-ACP methyl ester carboxylesterase
VATGGHSKLAFNLRFIDLANPVAQPGRVAANHLPVLLLTGDPALGALVTDADADALAAALPQLQRAHLPGAGHNLRRDEFAAYMAALRLRLAAGAAA